MLRAQNDVRHPGEGVLLLGGRGGGAEGALDKVPQKLTGAADEDLTIIK